MQFISALSLAVMRPEYWTPEEVKTRIQCRKVWKLNARSSYIEKEVSNDLVEGRKALPILMNRQFGYGHFFQTMNPLPSRAVTLLEIFATATIIHVNIRYNGSL